MKPLLTLAMIVRDEAATLERCLNSVQGCADEMVVVDTGSVDASIEIAKSFGAKVIQFAWQDDYGAARNEALAHVETPWILVLDGDEWLDPDAGARIRSSLGGDCPAYVLRRFDTFADGSRGEGQFLRLWKRHPDLRYETVIHEQITPNQISATWGSEPRVLDAWVWHDGYAQPPTPERLAFDERLLHKQLTRTPDSIYFQCILLANLVKQRKPEAWPVLNNVIAWALERHTLADSPVPEVSTAFCILLENTPPEHHNSPIPQAVAQLGMRWFGDAPIFLAALGDFEVRAGNVGGALAVYRHMAELARLGSYSRIRSFHPDLLGRDLWIRLAVVARHGRERAVAEDALAQLAAIDPSHPSLAAEREAWSQL